MEKYDVRLIIERMKEIVKAQNDKVLATILDIKPTNISNWRNRNSLPLEYIIDFAKKTDISVDWLLFGKSSNTLDTAQQMALTAFNALNEQQKISAISFMAGLTNNETSPNSITQTAQGNVQYMVAGNMTK